MLGKKGDILVGIGLAIGILLLTGAALIFNGEIAGAATYSGSGDCGSHVNNNSNMSGDMSCSGTGLIINQSDLTLNCFGFSLQGDGTSIGINITGKNNITLVNCTVEGFAEGVTVYSSKNITIKGNTINNNSIGITIDTSENNNLTLNIFNNSGDDTYISDSGLNNSIWFNHFYNRGVNDLSGGNNSYCINNKGNFYKRGIGPSTRGHDDCGALNMTKPSILLVDKTINITWTNQSVIPGYNVTYDIYYNYTLSGSRFLIGSTEGNNMSWNTSDVNNGIYGVIVEPWINGSRIDGTNIEKEVWINNGGGTCAVPYDEMFFSGTLCPGTYGIEDVGGNGTIHAIGSITCNGTTLIGTTAVPGSAAILVESRNGVTIQDCKIEGFRNGIRVNSSDGVNLINNTINGTEDDYGECIRITNSNSADVINNTVFDCGGMGGIKLEYTENSDVIDNIAFENFGPSTWNGVGIQLAYSNDTLIKNNLIYGNKLYGIYLYHGSNRNELRGNVLANHTGDSHNGIFLLGTDANPTWYNKIINNTAYGNTRGIQLGSTTGGTSYNILENNTVHSNSAGFFIRGVVVVSTRGNNFTNNIAHDNTIGPAAPGFYILGEVYESRFNDNLVYNNDYGFQVSSNNNMFYNNEMHNHSTAGFVLESSANNNSLDNNTVRNSTQDGFLLKGNDNNLTNNKAFWNMQTGLQINEDRNRIVNNSFYENQGAGIATGSWAQYNYILDNEIRNNGNPGFNLPGDDSVVMYNSILNHPRDGMLITGERNNISYNIIVNNTLNAVTGWDSSIALTGHYNLLYYNNITGGHQKGIGLDGGDYNTLFGNTITNHTEEAIRVQSFTAYNNITQNILNNNNATLAEIILGNTISSYNNTIWLNHLYGGGIEETIGNGTNFCLNGEGNFYEESINWTDIGDNARNTDCGPSNITNLNAEYSGVIDIDWTNQSVIPGYNVTYEIFYNSSTESDIIGSTEDNNISWNTTSVSDGTYTIRLIPWINGSRINGTNDYQLLDVNNTISSTVSLTYPHSGFFTNYNESGLDTGEIINITWTDSSDPWYYVDYSTTGGNTWSFLNLTQQEYFEWNISKSLGFDESVNYSLRVTGSDITNNYTSDTSDNSFWIGHCNATYAGGEWETRNTTQGDIIVCKNRNMNTTRFNGGHLAFVNINMPIFNHLQQSTSGGIVYIINSTLSGGTNTFTSPTRTYVINTTIYQVYFESQFNSSLVNIYPGLLNGILATGDLSYKVNFTDSEITYAVANLKQNEGDLVYHTAENSSFRYCHFKGSSKSTFVDTNCSRIFLYSNVIQENASFQDIKPGAMNSIVANGTGGYMVNLSNVYIAGADIDLMANDSFNTVVNSTLLQLETYLTSTNRGYNLNVTNLCAFYGESYTFLNNTWCSNYLHIFGFAEVDFDNSSVFLIDRVGSSSSDNPIIRGTLNITNKFVSQWYAGANATRFYPIYVYNHTGGLVDGAGVNITHNGKVLWSGTTNPQGYVEANLTFNKSTNATIFDITASWNPIAFGSVRFTSNTPIIIMGSNDTDGDGDLDETDCAPLDPNTLSPRDDLSVNRSMTLCSGTYYLNDTGDDGIIIMNASNVVLTCNGTFIIGDGDTSSGGIFSNYQHNNTIQNCSVYNYDRSIYLTNTNNNTIYNCDVGNCTGNCLTLGYSSDNKIINNTAHDGPGNGVYLYLDSHRNNITRNLVHDVLNFAFESSSGDNNSFIDNFAHNASNCYSISSDGNLFDGNTAADCLWGIALESPASYNLVSDNILQNSVAQGIDLNMNCRHNNFTGNIVNTSSDSVLVQGAADNNTFWLNHFYGAGIDDAWTNNNYSLGLDGNFYEESIPWSSIGHNDIGPSNITIPDAVYSGTIKINWTNQSVIHGYNLTYEVFYNSSTESGSIGSTEELNLTWDTTLRSDGAYTIKLVPWINGSRINGTNILQSMSIINGPGDTDGDGDPDVTDCAPLDPNRLSPRDNLKVNRSMTLCPGTYYINDTAAQIGILFMDASNVVLTCDNTIIIGNGTTPSNAAGYGIYSSLKINNTIQHCTIKNYQYGAYLIANSNNYTFFNNTFDGNFWGILMNPTYYSEVFNNTLSNNRYGIEIQASQNNLFSNNIVNDNTQSGITIGGGLYNIFSNNKIYNNSPTGITASGFANSNYYMGNEILENSYGMSIIQCNNNNILNNTIKFNTIGGMRIGLNFVPSIGNNISGNIFDANTNDELAIYSNSPSNNIWLNHFYEDGVNDGTGNGNNYCYNSEGNFYEELILVGGIGHNDCGQSIITGPTGGSVSGTIQVNWTRQSRIPTYNMTYEILFDEQPGGNTQLLNYSWDTTLFPEGLTTIKLIPWINGSRINGTIEYGFVTVDNLPPDSDGDGDPDATDCNDADASVFSPYDDLHINFDTTLCPGTYYLNDSGSTGIVIMNATGVSLTCDNTILVGTDSGAGIYSYSEHDNLIQDCNLVDYGQGIYLEYSNDTIITNLTVTGSVDGFYTSYSTNITITNSTSSNHSNDGFYISSSENTLTNNVAYNNSNIGFFIVGNNSVLRNNSAYNNDHGIYLSTAHNNNLTNNTVNDNQLGFTLSNSHNNNIISNIAYDDTQGFILGQSSGNILRGNVVYNEVYGIYLESNNNTVINNSIYNNSNTGIELDGDYNIITNNTISGNSYAIYIYAQSDYNNITQNILNTSTTGFFDLALEEAANNSIWLNHLYENGVNDPWTNNTYCIGSEGNFYEEDISSGSIGHDDCGQTNITAPSSGTYGGLLNIIWQKQSAIPGYTVTYEVILNNNPFDNTTSLTYGLDTSLFANGPYTIRLVPWINGSRINGTNDQSQTFSIFNACGDGTITPGETCDGLDLSSRVCSDFDKFAGGSLSCRPDCLINTSNCTGGDTGGSCPDNIIQTGETCEGTNYTGLTCLDFDTFLSGTLSCSNCQINTSNCSLTSVCGDGLITGTEDCDGIYLGGESCVGLGYDSGTLQCNGACSFDTSSCVSPSTGVSGGAPSWTPWTRRAFWNISVINVTTELKKVYMSTAIPVIFMVGNDLHDSQVYDLDGVVTLYLGGHSGPSPDSDKMEVIYEGDQSTAVKLIRGRERYDLKIGEEMYLDLNRDGHDEFYIEFRKVEGNRAVFYVKRILKPVEPEPEKEIAPIKETPAPLPPEKLEDEYKSPLYLFIAILLLIIMIITVVTSVRRHTESFTVHKPEQLKSERPKAEEVKKPEPKKSKKPLFTWPKKTEEVKEKELTSLNKDIESLTHELQKEKPVKGQVKERSKWGISGLMGKIHTSKDDRITKTIDLKKKVMEKTTELQKTKVEEQPIDPETEKINKALAELNVAIAELTGKVQKPTVIKGKVVKPKPVKIEEPKPVVPVAKPDPVNVKKELHKQLKDLEKDIKTLSGEDITEEEVIKKLKKAGWSDKHIDIVMHEIHRPHNQIHKLYKYAQKQGQKGKSKEEVREILETFSWPEEIIDLILEIKD